MPPKTCINVYWSSYEVPKLKILKNVWPVNLIQLMLTIVQKFEEKKIVMLKNYIFVSLSVTVKLKFSTMFYLVF